MDKEYIAYRFASLIPDLTASLPLIDNNIPIGECPTIGIDA
jgi:hypothetical protein